MATKQIDRVFGVQERALLAAIKGVASARLIPLVERGKEVVMVRTMYMLIITFATEALTKKHVIADATIEKASRDLWGKFEQRDVQAQLFATTELREADSGTLARKLTTKDGEHTVWVEKATLDIWAAEARSLADYQFYALVDGDAPIEKTAIRVERTRGCVCGYIMPMRGLREQVY